MIFKAMDANDDGMISKEEFLGFHERNRPPYSQMHHRPCDQKPPFPMNQHYEKPRPGAPEEQLPPPPVDPAPGPATAPAPAPVPDPGPAPIPVPTPIPAPSSAG